MSMPRCPAEYSVAGARNSRVTVRGASTGQTHELLNTPANAGSAGRIAADNDAATSRETPVPTVTGQPRADRTGTNV
ncbi:unannotated protein [freshwater metagenome]|uniref:Unannotated protein n=1 Tax=freshwater metagenome TaxID=449393 RepID=A0A6J6CTD4_9ZZZZ